MSANPNWIPQSAARLVPAIAGTLMLLTTADGALAHSGRITNAPLALTAASSGIVRDHRGERATPQQPTRCHLYAGHWTGYGCNGVVVRDHRH